MYITIDYVLIEKLKLTIFHRFILANSEIYWIDVTFDWSVNLLYKVAGLLGISYEEINIWLFVIIGPLFFLISICLNYYFYKKNKKAKENN